MRAGDAGGHAARLTARDIAARTAMAIDNALLYRRERPATPTLRRHPLPARLPDVPWARSARRCLPARNGTLAAGPAASADDAALLVTRLDRLPPNRASEQGPTHAPVGRSASEPGPMLTVSSPNCRLAPYKVGR